MKTVEAAGGWRVGQWAMLKLGACKGGNVQQIRRWFGVAPRQVTAIYCLDEARGDYALRFHTESGYGSLDNFIHVGKPAAIPKSAA